LAEGGQVVRSIRIAVVAFVVVDIIVYYSVDCGYEYDDPGERADA
jgi:hypothetical protein